MTTQHILVIEDDDLIREAIGTFLGFHNYSFEEAANGADAIKAVETGNFGLIFCDINLPDIQGTQILQFARAQQKTADTPFIFLTAFADDKDIKQGLAMGATDYITKPFTRKKLIEVAEKILGPAGG